MGVGIGEAALGPAAYSLIGDLFDESRRGRAMGIYSSGVSVGGGLAFILGGLIVAFAATADLSGTPLDGFSGWQIVFLLLGPPGILVALLMWTVPEPRNTPTAATAIKAPPVLPLLRRHATFFSSLFVASAISGMIMTALLYWAPSFFLRVHGLEISEAGLILGLGLLIGGPVGAIVGGATSDHWTRRGVASAPVWTIAIGIALMTASGITATIVASSTVGGLLLGSAFFWGSFAYPGGAAAIQKSTPPDQRARVAAVYLFVVTLLSAAVGPTLIAMITDYVFADPNAVGRSLVVALAIVGPIGVLCAILAAIRLKGVAATETKQKASI